MSRLSLGEAFVTVRYDLARLPSDLSMMDDARKYMRELRKKFAGIDERSQVFAKDE